MGVNKPGLQKAIVGLVGFVGAIVVIWVLMVVKPELFPAGVRSAFPMLAGLLIGIVFVSGIAAYFANRK